MQDKAAFYLSACDAAVAAAREAARVIEAHAGRLSREAVRTKGLHDLVTDVDVEAERVITGVLAEAFPGFGVLAEEGVADAPGEGYRWIIDPIDGTTNFTRGVPPYAVSIGLQRTGEGAGEVVVGVVLDVARGELFTAVRGQGLRVDGQPYRVSTTPALDESLVTTGFPYRSVDHLDAYLAVLGTCMRRSRGVRRPGSASVDLAYVACGRFDAFFETGLKAWDVAAGLLLVEEAGGRVTDFADASNPLFAGQLLATNGLVHEELMEMVQPLRPYQS